MLLVGEERGQRISQSPEKAVDKADDFRKIGAADGVADVGGERGEGLAVLRAVGAVLADRGGEVLVAEVQHGEAYFLGLLGDARADMRAAQRDFAAAGGEGL